MSEIDRIANSTKYAGVELTNGNFTAGNTLKAASSTWDTAVDNVYDVNITNAAAGSYVATYSATSNKLTIAKGSVTESVTITAAPSP